MNYTKRNEFFLRYVFRTSGWPSKKSKDSIVGHVLYLVTLVGAYVSKFLWALLLKNWCEYEILHVVLVH